MKITVEISLYPLKDDFESAIITFIKALRSYDGLEVNTNAMSTYVAGDFDLVFKALSTELKKVYELLDTSSTVIKVINRKLPVEAGFLDFK